MTDSAMNPESGGIARITYIMSQALQTYFHYSVYAYYGQEDFNTFIHKIGPCIVIIQSPGKVAPKVLETVKKSENVRIITVFHGTPGYELIPLRCEIINYRIWHNIERKWTIKQLLLQLGEAILPKKYFLRKLQTKYARPYEKADKIVVLSAGLIDQYQKIAPGNKELFVAIPNALSFSKVSLPDVKAKEVLVVARLDDWHKRILDILKIWSIVQKKNAYSDWTLRIVGDGIDKSFYEEYTRKKIIPNICFDGQQNPLPYYQNSSIFLMTSACEGLPMTVLEAQQCGCVPILYDSFASAKDIVTNGENGFLIPNQDSEQFVNTMMQLMSDANMRKKMSAACIQSSERYSTKNIASQWNELLQSL